MVVGLERLRLETLVRPAVSVWLDKARILKSSKVPETEPLKKRKIGLVIIMIIMSKTV